MVVLVDHGTASAAEIVTGALQDRGRAKVVGTHTYGKGVFQEIDPLPNGGALDFTIGEYFTPNGHNLGGGGVRARRRHHAKRPRLHEPDVEPRHGAAGRRAHRRRRDQVSANTRDARQAARVAVLRRKGKFLVAEPLFGPGPQIVVSRDRKADVGDLVVVGDGRAANRRGARRAVIERRLGRPDVARDVISALMLDRGLRRSFDPAVDHDAREVAARAGGGLRQPTRPARAADVHDRPGQCP